MNNNRVVEDLRRIYNVSDVYFHKGVLWVQNTYDIPDVLEYVSYAVDQYIPVRLMSSDELMEA